ncbi:cytochrome b/b6 domain-containing protein [Sphingomonas sp. PAMC 26605]|uniref:cytochrome b/b6 domain-containing protein n=1 Tax=Sphingomonas sp. PAMC 26605 TaxID=1112214 RepID=UPI00026CAD13|nr:cytochrome b/b6 domain-containing protein [Sphingomonas sp. PAMC 26605]
MTVNAASTAPSDQDFVTHPAPARKAKRLHPWPVRVMHWLNAIAIIIMIGSGWGIYNDSVIFHFIHFPAWMKIGTWAGKSLQWHFAFMWLLVINGAFYLSYGLLTGRFRERFFPIRIAGLIGTVRDTLKLKLAHEDLTIYNPVQKLLYLVVITAACSQVLTGLAIWKPVQFQFLTALFGGFQGARLVHFLGMAVIVGFLIVHVALSFAVPTTLLAMFTGGPRVGTKEDRS